MFRVCWSSCWGWIYSCNKTEYSGRSSSSANIRYLFTHSPQSPTISSVRVLQITAEHNKSLVEDVLFKVMAEKKMKRKKWISSKISNLDRNLNINKKYAILKIYNFGFVNFTKSNKRKRQRNRVFVTNSNFIIPISLQHDGVNLLILLYLIIWSNKMHGLK